MGGMAPLAESASKPTLEMHEVRAILASAASSGASVFSITGSGEPLADRNALRAIEIASDLGMTSILATNGSIISRREMAFLRERGVTLAFSIDTANPEKYAEATGTSPAMFRRVARNFLEAQEMFAGTRSIIESAGGKLEIFRLAVHATLDGRSAGAIEGIRKMLDPKTTLLSVSPVASAGSALENGMAAPKFNGGLTEKHIAAIPNPKNGKGVCGFFAFGLDINFDGEILLDAHAIQTRGILGNIRDFALDAGIAYESLRAEKERFIDGFMEGFCPVRSPKLEGWIGEKKSMAQDTPKLGAGIGEKKSMAQDTPKLGAGIGEKMGGARENGVARSMASGRSLLKFAYIREGAGRFCALMETPDYATSSNERKILAQNPGAIRDFIAGRDAVVLGAGDGSKLSAIIGSAKNLLLVDISKEMLGIAAGRLGGKARERQCDFGQFEFSECESGTVFIMLGNTLANEEDMPAFLKRLAAVEGSRALVGIELLEGTGKGREDGAALLEESYRNDADSEFLFTPLERLGVKRGDGELGISFNREMGRIEARFTFSDGEAKARFCSRLGLDAARLHGILLGTSLKISRSEFAAMAEKAGFSIKCEFAEGSSRVFLLERAA